MYYLTFNDQPSGIYQSQVIDVVNYLSNLSGNEVTLIAFLPLKGFKENKRIIRSQYKKSIVIPMIFGMSRWRKHKFLLKIFTSRKSSVITRGPLANALSLGNFQKVVYDGRAAVKAEVEEYDVTAGNKQLGLDFIEAEKAAVLKSDFRIAVSNKLVEYWSTEFNYSSNNHVVIPCTLTSVSKAIDFHESNQKSNVKIVYSGSTSGWQSFEKVVFLLDDLLQKQDNVEVLFLTNEVPAITKLISKYSNRVVRKFVTHEEVHIELQQCDYGILIRDDKITNQVASPVKYAEYLSAGLKVLISPKLGDFSDFTIIYNCGIIIKNEIPFLSKPSIQEKNNIKTICSENFDKNCEKISSSYQNLYNKIIQ